MGISLSVPIYKQLTSSFVESQVDFSQDHNQRYLQLEAIYDQHYTNQFSNSWNNHDDSISIDEIQQAINDLDPKKDPGPMAITAEFFKFISSANCPSDSKHFSHSPSVWYFPTHLKTEFSNSYSAERRNQRREKLQRHRYLINFT